TAVLCIELINMVMQKDNMHDTDTFEVFKYIIKMWTAVWLVSHAFQFSMAVYDVAQHTGQRGTTGLWTVG
ncbi:CD0415/CD1112 family protein, partial [Enterococcus faecalis]|uniref:VirB6/TrbL-like conjugal transfer protein, CD1112 family n=1 Tax=Enterococcus faecalis TaxID=1351 RepID=UPI0022A77DC1